MLFVEACKLDAPCTLQDLLHILFLCSAHDVYCVTIILAEPTLCIHQKEVCAHSDDKGMCNAVSSTCGRPPLAL